MEQSANVVVIPAFNEAATISRVVEKVRSKAAVIVVDDHSSDDTASLAEAAGAIVVRHSDNCGYESALESGIQEAVKKGFECIVTFDADGQHDANLLDIFFERLKTFDLVIGVRPKKARFSESVMGLYFRARFGVRDILCGMKGYRAELYRKIGYFDRNKTIGAEIVVAAIKKGFSFTQVPVPIHVREDAPRFGSILKANFKIFRALGQIVRDDFAL